MRDRWKIIVGTICVALSGVIAFQIPFGRSVESIILEKLQIQDVANVPRASDGLIDLVTIYNDRILEEVPLDNNMVMEFFQATQASKRQSRAFPPPPEIYAAPGAVQSISNEDGGLSNILDYLNKNAELPDSITSKSSGEYWEYLREKEKLARQPWTRVSLPEAADYLDAVSGHLERIESVVDKQFRVPMESLDMHDGTAVMWIMNTLSFRDVAFAFLVRAMNRLGEIQVEDCLNDIRIIRTFGKRLSAESDRTTNLIGIVFYSVATLGDIEVLKSQALNAGQCRTYRQELRRQTEGRIFGWNLDELKYDLLNIVQQLAAGKSSEYLFWSDENRRVPLPVTWQSTLEILFKYHNRLAECVAIDDCRQRLEKTRELDREISNLKESTEKYYWRGTLAGANSRGMLYGKRIATKEMRNWAGLVKAEIREASKIDLVIVGLAIEEFRIDNGALPITLNDLVPAYLNEIPTDRYFGKPLKYCPTDNGYVLYSLGTDEVDDLRALLNREVPPTEYDLKRWQTDDKDFGIRIEYAKSDD